MTRAALAPADDKFLRRWTILLLLLGLAWRLGRFATMRPIWFDEASLDLNILTRSLTGMLQPLDYEQVAPPLFLTLEWLIQHTLGNAEWVVRLLPLAAGIAAALLYWRWCRLLLPTLAAAIATGLFAVGFYPVRYSAELKPYAFDQLATVGMLYLATRWIQQPQSVKFGWLLALLMPAIVLGSYPSVFVAGGICLALLPTLYQRRSVMAWSAWSCIGVALVGTFVILLTLVAQGQYDRTSGFMDDYWQRAFPPANFLGYLRWLVVAHTGDIFAYPQGGTEGGSTGTFLVFLAGVIFLLRQRRWHLLFLLLSPFTLTFIAAAFHRYPYNGGPRLTQHLAPAICFLTGYGAQCLLEKLPSDLWRRRGTGAALVALTLFGIGAFAFDLIKPYKSAGDQRVRAIVHDLAAESSGQMPICVMQPTPKVPVTFQLYFRWLDLPISWNTARNWDQALASSIVVLNFDPSVPLESLHPPGPDNWTLQRQVIRTDLSNPNSSDPIYYQATYWQRVQ